ncbi:Thiol-disulfide oxidoreductase ResA [uncultured archaeon]|nr:Thiol-disulfide oxidoreductase ResA [uncultured archaeon]
MISGIKKKPILILVFLFFFLTILTGCTKEKSNTGEDFIYKTLDGESKHLNDFYGKVIVLDCMAVKCQPCMYQMLELKKISENYSKNDVIILSIDVWVSSGETASMLQDMIDAFNNQINLTLDWMFGLDDSHGTIQNTYASTGVPTLYIFDKKGNIYYSHVGYEPYTDLAVKIDEAIIKN